MWNLRILFLREDEHNIRFSYLLSVPLIMQIWTQIDNHKYRKSVAPKKCTL